MSVRRREVDLGARAEKVFIKEKQFIKTSAEGKRLKQQILDTKEWLDKEGKRAAVEEKEVQTAAEELQRMEPLWQKQIMRLDDILPRYERIRRLEKAYAQNLGKMQEVLEQCRAASEEYEEKYKRFFEEQAGILAKELKEGQSVSGVWFYNTSKEGRAVRESAGSESGGKGKGKAG